jgi:hypothetical protein
MDQLTGRNVNMNYQVTGNEYVSLPAIRENGGAIESISCLYMNLKGMIELKGRNGLIRPFLQCASIRSGR